MEERNKKEKKYKNEDKYKEIRLDHKRLIAYKMKMRRKLIYFPV